MKLDFEYLEQNNKVVIVDGFKTEAFALYGEYFFNESPFSILASFDNLSYKNIHATQYIIAGINYTPNPMFKFGLNWRNAKSFAITPNPTHDDIFFTGTVSF